jgi:DNA-binding GntR family transcriptional regulator
MREQIYRYRVEYLKEGETRDLLVKEHEELTRAIKERDVERAKQLSLRIREWLFCVQLRLRMQNVSA